MPPDRRGFTLTEVLLTAAIVGLMLPPLAKSIQSLSKFVTKAFLQWRSADEVRPVDVFLDQDLHEMVELREAKTDSIQFVLDSNRMPGYDPNGDLDGDGVTNALDPDDDGDLDAFVAPGNFRWTGNDLDDDDEDGDRKTDIQIRFVCAGEALTRGVSVNEAPWEWAVTARGLEACGFDYFGSANRSSGTGPDTGEDGIPGTGDAGEGDGIVTAREIDWTLPPNGPGNRSGLLDTSAELGAVSFVKATLRVDLNRDGVTELKFEKEIGPPMLSSRRRDP